MQRSRCLLKMLCIFKISCALPFNILAQASVKPVSPQQLVSVLQQPSSEIKELNIGDIVPDAEFQMMNYSKPTARLSDFKGKLIIFDFWATWCGSCLDAFPKMDTLQKIYGDKLQVILVNSNETGDNVEKIKKFFENWKMRHGYELDLPTIANDSFLTQLFRHSEMPHYAWVGADGFVKAITGPKQVNTENIDVFLKKGLVSLPKKVDFLYDRFMFLGDDTKIDSISTFSFFIKGELQGLKPTRNLRMVETPEQGLIKRGIAMRNCALIEIYQAGIKFDESFKYYNLKVRTIIETKNPLDIIRIPAASAQKGILYSYDIVVPVSRVHNLAEIILTDLNHHSDYFGRVEKREVECYVIARDKKAIKNVARISSPVHSSTTKDSIQKIEGNITDIVISLNAENPNLGLPVVDEASFKGKLKLRREAFYDIPKLTEDLATYGLKIIKARRKVAMFVISDKK